MANSDPAPDEVRLNANGNPEWDEVSPDGRTLVHWLVTQGRMSHEIRTPRIMDAVTRDPILLLRDGGYDGTIRWTGDGRFEIRLRHYWRPARLELQIDRNSGTFRTVDPNGTQGPDLPVASLSRFVERHFTARTGNG